MIINTRTQNRLLVQRFQFVPTPIHKQNKKCSINVINVKIMSMWESVFFYSKAFSMNCLAIILLSTGIDSGTLNGKWKMKRKSSGKRTNKMQNREYTLRSIPTAIKLRKRNDLNTMDILLRKFIVVQNPTIHYGDTWMQGTFISF